VRLLGSVQHAVHRRSDLHDGWPVRRPLAVASLALAACTAQHVAATTDAAPAALTCDGAHPTTVDALWDRYLQAAPTTGMGGCAFSSCHGGINGGGGLRFTNAQQFVSDTVDVMATTEANEMRVEMRDPADSYVYKRLLPSAGEERMPPGGPYLDDGALDDVLGWICSGDSPDGGTSDGGAPDGGAVHP